MYIIQKVKGFYGNRRRSSFSDKFFFKKYKAKLVTACYREFLLREPENTEVVAQQSGLKSFEKILRQFLNSEEFRKSETKYNNYLADRVAELYELSSFDIELDISVRESKEIFDRIKETWTKLGAEDPFWSVLTHDEFRIENFSQEIQEKFFETGAYGRGSVEIIERLYRRNNQLEPKKSCLEFGCGVGRMTIQLAKKYDRVIAVDISPKNIEIGKRLAEQKGIKNIEFYLLNELEDLQKLPKFEILFSMIALQHNPPPIQRLILEILLSKIYPGGGAIFQTLTHKSNYKFSLSQYLKSSPSGMEMHCLPMSEIFRIFRAENIITQEVIGDNWTGDLGSHTFYGLKAEEN